jgi:hypothetical protein
MNWSKKNKEAVRNSVKNNGTGRTGVRSSGSSFNWILGKKESGRRLY